MNTGKLMGTADVARELGISPARVQHMIWAKRLPALKVANAWIIREEDLKLVRNRKPGRQKAAAHR